MTELKPCPFCGGEAYFDCMEHDAEMNCMDFSPECKCGATIISTERFTRAQAIAAWNTRAAEEGKAELVEALENYAKDYDHERGCSQWDGGSIARAALARVRGEG